MQRAHNNVALIGMPGAGKSTLGVLLAKRTAREFLDTDLQIQESQGAVLQQIIDEAHTMPVLDPGPVGRPAA